VAGSRGPTRSSRCLEASAGLATESPLQQGPVQVAIHENRVELGFVQPYAKPYAPSKRGSLRALAGRNKAAR